MGGAEFDTHVRARMRHTRTRRSPPFTAAARSQVPDWHGLVLCVGLLPAIVCFTIFGTNGGLGAPCDTAVAVYLLVQGIVSATNIIFFCCAMPLALAMRAPGVRTAALHVQSLTLVFWFGWAVYGSVQVWGTHPYRSHKYRWALAVDLDAGGEARGAGCEPGLYWGARSWLVFTYVMAAIFSCCLASLAGWYACAAHHRSRSMQETLRVAAESLEDGYVQDPGTVRAAIGGGADWREEPAASESDAFLAAEAKRRT
jgi:hypothetical protein